MKRDHDLAAATLEDVAMVVFDRLAEPMIGSEEYQAGWRDARIEALAEIYRLQRILSA